MTKPDPDESLEALEAELAQHRALRGRSQAGRTAFRVWSLVIILALIIGALLVLQYLVSQIPPPGERRPAGGQESARE